MGWDNIILMVLAMSGASPIAGGIVDYRGA